MAEHAEKKLCQIPRGADADDLITALPDSVLQHILSFLPMVHVIATSLLSRRWRYLWTSVPTLDFGSRVFSNNSVVADFINRSVMLYEGGKIRKFRVSVDSEHVEFDHIDSWIRFAVDRAVEELDMDFSDGYRADPNVVYEEDVAYNLPHYLFKCKGLKVLRLILCDLNVPSPFHFQSLQKLHLYDVKLTELDTSVCPLLEDLIVSGCRSTCNVNISSPNLRLRNVKIEEFFDGYDEEYELVVHAPSLLFIDISASGSMRRRYNIKNVSSVVNATLRFSALVMDANFVSSRLVKLFRKLTHAKTLNLCRLCIQVLSLMEARNVKIRRLSATHLEVESNVNKRDLPGLTYLLRNSCYLKSLTINIYREPEEMDVWMLLTKYHFDESKSWELLELALSARSHIKSMKINHLLESRINSNIQAPCTDLGKFLEETEEEIKLVKVILKWCNMLEKMFLKPSFHPFLEKSPLKSELLLSVTKKILALPRASVNAQVYLV